LSFAEIAVCIGRDRTVVWREYKRNCLPNGDYHALFAHALATLESSPAEGI
jgi:IS30 family transposase